MTPEARVALGLAMLADVLSAAVAVAGTTVVTSDEAAWRVAAELEVDVLAGVPMGQGPAVEAALRRLEPVGLRLQRPGPVRVRAARRHAAA
jgi:2-phospho-L-lactate guanylyltransferase (CobY/MobA/RfbA family)